jgi:hypothetical protein
VVRIKVFFTGLALPGAQNNPTPGEPLFYASVKIP